MKTVYNMLDVLVITAFAAATAVVCILVPELLQHVYPPPLQSHLIFFIVVLRFDGVNLTLRRTVDFHGGPWLDVGAILLRKVTRLGL